MTDISVSDERISAMAAALAVRTLGRISPNVCADQCENFIPGTWARLSAAQRHDVQHRLVKELSNITARILQGDVSND